MLGSETIRGIAMINEFEADISEEEIARYHKPVLKLLLQDKTTQQNIIWATSDYEYLGNGYDAKDHITIASITSANADIIQPRILKTKLHQTNRTRDKAEVFTPSWVCNEQNNLIDEAWFGRKNVFNQPVNGSWYTYPEQIKFSAEKGRQWTDYVDARRLEITCGEAPYLVSRYDTVTGDFIPVENRIGLLDRKLRVVYENTASETEWLKWALRAVQSVYGYEYQGDSLLLARENIIYTYHDYMMHKLHRSPTLQEFRSIATVIAWNIWQMDGLSYTVPFGKLEDRYKQISFFDLENEDNGHKPQQHTCRIMDWRTRISTTYQSLME